ncbi:polysaccharide biosynthesis/export family protein [Luteolibacter ambystomatis]|uniref:Polysaccharide biosynthesis/export family protein n=2 Tax=Luteolibacter ambystomatis TaxID=2824561 RepID=A0A975J0Y8_9BACT|nr:polysaccharide biosynthesis/export family protein [Luteolibacter ambystomatis]QUE52018.1 polysaccharide biosynthesis/export family protein [Luteolibacter ambystomatis]
MLPLIVGLALPFSITLCHAELAVGDTVKITLRGVPADEQQKVNGDYRIGDSGTIRLPMIDTPVTARGLTGDQLARAAEKAYRDAGVYEKPAIETEVKTGVEATPDQSVVYIGGQVRKPGPVPFAKGMTLLQALKTAGDRNEFGGRNIVLTRKGKATRLDFRKQEDKNTAIEPGDVITVEQAGALEVNRG